MSRRISIFYVFLLILSSAATTAKDEDKEEEILDTSGQDNVVLLNYDGETISDATKNSPGMLLFYFCGVLF